MRNRSPETENGQSEFHAQVMEYRKSLVGAEQTMQGEYDKSVLLLSGGALGVSMTFLKEIVGAAYVQGDWLLLAWVSWGVSVTCTLASFFTSIKAFRSALQDTDAQMIYLTLANSFWSKCTKVLNAFAGILFFIGVILMVVFARYNLPR